MRDLPRPGIEPMSPALAGRFFTTDPPGKPLQVEVLVTQLCLTLCDAMDHSLPGSSVHGILQANIAEWVAASYTDVHFTLRDP